MAAEPQNTDGSRDLIMIHRDNFWATVRSFGGFSEEEPTAGKAYWLLTEHLWKLNDLPATDEAAAKIAECSLEQWQAFKPAVWPKIVDHTGEWFWSSEKRADEILEQQARESAEAEG